jgi:hypothetical protein
MKALWMLLTCFLLWTRTSPLMRMAMLSTRITALNLPTVMTARASSAGWRYVSHYIATAVKQLLCECNSCDWNLESYVSCLITWIAAIAILWFKSYFFDWTIIPYKINVLQRDGENSWLWSFKVYFNGVSCPLIHSNSEVVFIFRSRNYNYF